MAAFTLSENLRRELVEFLQEHRSSELIPTYLFYLEKKYKLHPVVFVRDKIVYPSKEEAASSLEKEGKLWHKTEIKVGYGPPSVNDQTKKIYICPFTGRVFGDNTHPNPQDAIYDWVSKCPENTEMAGGVKAKRFFVSEDPEVIKSYIKPEKQPITKTVYSSAITGKLFNSKESIAQDLFSHYLKPMTLVEVQNQSRFSLEKEFLKLIDSQLEEDKITAFVESLAEYQEFHPYVAQWVETEE